MKTPIFTQISNRISILIIIIASFSILSLSSCLKDSDFEQGGIQESYVSGLTIINGAPDSPAFDFTLNKNLVKPENVPFGYRITLYGSYIGVYPGTYSASFYKHGTYNNALYTEKITLEKSKYYSLFLGGTKENLTSLIIEDDLTRPVGGKARLRFLNLSPDAGQLDFTIEDDVLFTSQKEFKAYTDFEEVSAGEYSAIFKSSTGDLVNFSFALELEAGKIYTVWARGLVDTIDDSQAFENGLIIHNP